MIWLQQAIRRAASREACTAGSRSAMRIPIMVMTTNNSTKVNAVRLPLVGEIISVLLVHSSVSIF